MPGSTPTVFISAASADLRDWRDVLHKAFERAGCKVFTQDQSFGTSTGDVLQLLREHLAKSDFVIHLVGMAYGAEPDQSPFPSHPEFKCSYTQFEYYDARRQPGKVIAFVCSENFPYLPFVEKAMDEADGERRRQLQAAHRDRVVTGRFLGTPLEAISERPLCEPIADVRKLLEAVAAAVGKIQDFSREWVEAARKELEAAAQKRHEELLSEIEDLPSRIVAALGQRGVVKPTFEFRANLNQVPKYAPPKLIGRGGEMKLLSDAWGEVCKETEKRHRILTFVALGGEGKTSLVAKWVAEFASRDWPGCDAAFAWSFYSQGVREQRAASSDLFLKEALTFFGDNADKVFAASSAGAHEKGQRLARLVGQRRSLLILDGLEPLQYPPTWSSPGLLKDQGIAALLRGLAENKCRGLCVVTTRYSIPDLKGFRENVAPEVSLLRLPRDAGVDLLKSFGVQGSERKIIPFDSGRELLNEFEKLVEDVKGHALTLNLLGSYLHFAYGGDIRKRDLIRLQDADERSENKHHYVHVMDAYVRWLSRGGIWARVRRLFSQMEREAQMEGERMLAMLRLVGLFDRPVTAACLDALLQTPAIAGLTEPLVDLNGAQRNTVLKLLESAKLVTVYHDRSGTFVSLDAHPHLREYFARRLRDQKPNAWRAAHRRLYEHLCATTPDKPQPTLEDLQPLYQSMIHGCLAGCGNDVYCMYIDRIERGQECYATRKLGVLGADIGAFASFFEKPWTELRAGLHGIRSGRLVGMAGSRLRAVGRLHEARQAFEASFTQRTEDLCDNAFRARHISEILLLLGEPSAIKEGQFAVELADRSGDLFERVAERAVLADVVFHFEKDPALAEDIFRAAEEIQRTQRQADFLHTLWGFKYCTVLLEPCVKSRWRDGASWAGAEGDEVALLKEIQTRAEFIAEEALRTRFRGLGLLDSALANLCLATVELMRRGVNCPPTMLDEPLRQLRVTEKAEFLPPALLARAWLRFLIGVRSGIESAQSDLDDAWDIAERGPMRLHMADIHLCRARLFFREKTYPWKSPQDDLVAAEKLINDCGYHRRDEELADAKCTILGTRP